MKNYWTYFAASMVSLIGSNYFIFTHGWYILQLTGEKASVGVTFSLFFLPSLIFLPLVGKLMDSIELKKLLLIFEGFKLSLLVVFTILFSYYPKPILVYCLAVLYGIAFVPYYPSVYVAVKRLVPQNLQTKYSHLMETSLQIANIVAVFSSGIVFEKWGFLVLLGGASACVVSGAVMMMRLDLPATPSPVRGMGRHLFSGYGEVARLIKGHPLLSRDQFLFGVFHQLPQAVILSGNIPLLLYVSDSMKKGPWEFGIFDALFGISALLSSILWSKWHRMSQSTSVQFFVTLLAGVSGVALFITPTTGVWPYVWVTLYGGFLISSKILARATVVRMIPPAQIGIFSTFFQTCGYTMMMVLFFGISWLNRSLSPIQLFAILGGVLFLYAIGLTPLCGFVPKKTAHAEPQLAAS